MARFGRFRLVTFDLRDTLIRLRTDAGKRFTEIANGLGIETNENAMQASFVEAWKKLRDEHPNFGLSSGLSLKAWWDKLIFETFRTQLSGPDDPRIEAVSQNVDEILTSPIQWQTCPGSLQLLAQLQDHEIRMGIVSNFDTRLDRLLDRMGLKEYFAFAVSSYSEGAEKPDRRLFNRALFLSRIPGIKAKEALHIGRQASADYQGARQAGWSSIIVSDWSPERILERYPSVQRNHVFPSLEEFRKKWAQGAVKW